jgi:hypothetical protein
VAVAAFVADRYAVLGGMTADYFVVIRSCDIVMAQLFGTKPLLKTGVTMAKAKKKIVRRVWTKTEVKQMKTMAKAKAGVKRTPGATSVMAAKLGVSLSMRS